jgi:hypothetical protein
MASGAGAYQCAYRGAHQARGGRRARADGLEALVTSTMQRMLLAQRAMGGPIAHSDRGG